MCEIESCPILIFSVKNGTFCEIGVDRNGYRACPIWCFISNGTRLGYVDESCPILWLYAKWDILSAIHGDVCLGCLEFLQGEFMPRIQDSHTLISRDDKTDFPYWVLPPEFETLARSMASAYSAPTSQAALSTVVDFQSL